MTKEEKRERTEEMRRIMSTVCRERFIDKARARIRMRDLDGLRGVYAEYYPRFFEWGDLRQRAFGQLGSEQSQEYIPSEIARALRLFDADVESVHERARLMWRIYWVWWAVVISLIAAAIAGIAWAVS